ncbi:MAG: cytochrome c biogenesis protein CcdA [Dermatophilaceae bacterium]
MPVIELTAQVSDPSTVASGALPAALAIAVVAGVVSFASPCVLPLVPGFLGYVTGLGDTPLAQRRRSRVVLGALLFVLGFSVVFVLSVSAASAMGAVLREYQSQLIRVGGVVVIAMALVFLGVGPQRELKTGWKPTAGLAGAPVLGVVFGLGWGPCTGPTLGAILALAAPLGAQGGSSIARGALLGLAYCIGLGLPFLLLAAGLEHARRASAWLRRHQRGVQRFGGLLLLAVGVLMVTGLWEGIMSWVQAHLVTGFETAI